MASIIAELRTAVTPPSAGEALSGVFGSISLTAWICLLLPQLITNYKAQSADALSMGFLGIWLLGDVTNLSGALFTNLSPSAIALGSYFCFADIILISQCLYYNTRNARRNRNRRRLASQATVDSEASEDEPLLSRQRSSSVPNGGLPGSHRRSSARRESSNLDPLTRIVTGEDETPNPNPWLHNALSLVAVYVVGAAGWFLSYKMGAWEADPGIPDPKEPQAKETVAALGMALGYMSAGCYLCARIPQIIKNYREKSTEGLALLFFLLSLTGNLTYGASLFSYSQESEYLLKALPWLLGSLGTVTEDLVIFGQFRLYSDKKESKVTTTGAQDGSMNGDAPPPAYEP